MNAFETTIDLPMEEAEAAVRSALQDHGFGVLTEIDVAATLHQKLGVERAPLKILGACNPAFAHRALTIDPSASLLLPCNVVLERADGGTHVAIVDPRDLMQGDAMAELADDAAALLAAVIDSVSAA